MTVRGSGGVSVSQSRSWRSMKELGRSLYLGAFVWDLRRAGSRVSNACAPSSPPPYTHTHTHTNHDTHTQTPPVHLPPSTFTAPAKTLGFVYGSHASHVRLALASQISN